MAEALARLSIAHVFQVIDFGFEASKDLYVSCITSTTYQVRRRKKAAAY